MSPFCGAVLDDTVEDDEADERRKLLAISFFNRLIPDELDEARSCPLLEAGTPFSTRLAPLLENISIKFHQASNMCILSPECKHYII